MSDHEQSSQPEPMLRLTISPEPTDEETAAIAAAVSLLSLTATGAQESDEEETVGRPSSWVITGRLSAHHAAPRARQRRWSRTLAWLERTR